MQQAAIACGHGIWPEVVHLWFHGLHSISNGSIDGVNLVGVDNCNKITIKPNTAQCILLTSPKQRLEQNFDKCGYENLNFRFESHSV